MSGSVPEDEKQDHRDLEAECWVLQTAIVRFAHCFDSLHLLTCEQAWKGDRLELVEYYHKKLEGLRSDLTTGLVERYVDTVYCVGRDLSTRNDWSTAVKWLSIAHEWINTPELDQLSKEAAELRLALTRALTQAHLHTEAHDRLEKAESLIVSLEGELGDAMMILLLRLEVLVADPGESFDASSYASVVRRMIATAELTDTTFKAILHHIRKLEDKSPSTGIGLLDQFLKAKVMPLGSDKWIEHVAVLRTHMAVSHRETDVTCKDLLSLLDEVKTVTEKTFSASATNAIQTVSTDSPRVNQV